MKFIFIVTIILFSSILYSKEERIILDHFAEEVSNNSLKNKHDNLFDHTENHLLSLTFQPIKLTNINNTLSNTIHRQKSELSLYKDLNNLGNFKPYEIEKFYSRDIRELFDESIKQSYRVNAQIYELKSKEHLYQSSKKYYIPSAALTSEYKRKLYKKLDPLRADDLTVELAVTMKLWSDNTGDQKSSAYYALVAEKENYNQIVNSIYSTINQNVLKIELSRKFLDNAEQYRVRMNKLLERMNRAVSVGLLKKSDRLFADISIKKFEDSVLNVKSQIEIYKNTINNITGNEIYDNQYGVTKAYIKEALTLNDDMFLIDNIIKENFDIRARKAQLFSDKLSALATNENFKAELVSTQNMTGTIPVGTKRKASFSFDPNNDSFLGIKFTFNGLNYDNYKQQKSEIELVSKKLIELDEFLYQTTINLDVLKEQYNLLNGRVKNIDNQIKLTLNVINILLQELLVDEASTLDIFRNVSSLSDLELSKLAVQNQLVDLVTQIYALNANIPNEFIIN